MPIGKLNPTIGILGPLGLFATLLLCGWGETTLSSLALLVLPSLVAISIISYLLRRLQDMRETLRARDKNDMGRLRMLMSNSPEGIWRTDSMGFTIEVNRSMATMLGYTPNEIQGRSFRDFLSEESVQVSEEAFTRCLRGEAMQFETAVRRRDDALIRVLVTTHPILDREGKFIEGIGIIRDITARHDVETERQSALSLLEATLESTADGLLVVDREGKIVRFNERFARIWGIPPEILQSRDDGRALEFVLAQVEEPEQFLSKVRKLYATPEAESFDTLRFRDGRVFERYSLPHRLDGVVIGRVWSFRNVTDREQALAEQRLAMEREATIARNLDAALFTLALDADARILCYEYVSRGAELLYGKPARELEGDPDFWQQRVHPDDFRDIVVPAFQRLLKLQAAVIEIRYETSSGIWRWHRSRLTPRLESDGLVHVDGIEVDVTDRVALEEQFRHSQKMEAVGQLAGGVAHDFNNILTAVLGYSDLLLSRMPKTDASRPAVEEIRKGGERAAALTRQLLAFSRRASTQPRVVDLNEAIRNLEPMFRRLVGENIQFDLALSAKIGRVRVDPTQLEQVIVNLIVNARDAMPNGGTITIRTESIVLSADDSAAALDPAPGPYARISISDTGVGIPKSVLEHMFEPFFTTKGPGRGTGLGLATVYGIVRQHGGRVRAISEPTRGAEFEILLPEVEDEPSRPEPEISALPIGTETVLIVEDDASLLTLARDALADLGYTVLAASRARDALRILEREGGRIQILVTDVIMPEMGGRELAEHARRISPGLPTLFVSGFTRDLTLVQDAEEAGTLFLEKPYTPLAFARKVREVLNSAPARLPRDADRIAR